MKPFEFFSVDIFNEKINFYVHGFSSKFGFLISFLKYQISKDNIFRWRAFGYEKAISAIKRHPKQITTHEEASKIPGKLLQKVIFINLSYKIVHHRSWQENG